MKTDQIGMWYISGSYVVDKSFNGTSQGTKVGHVKLLRLEGGKV